MESTITQRSTRRSSVLDQAIDLSRVNWEALYFVVLLIVVIGTRFWDLGSRALHHDESIHAFYSFQFFTGNPWAYDPAYHGPFLYNMVAIAYWLFGVTDASTRVMPAIFGTLLISLCWFMRPYIGRLGAIAAATIVAFSPSIMYYSRALRHDIFALVGTFLFFLAILGFLRTHQGKFLFLGAVGIAIGVASHELIYINIGIFVLFLLVAWGILRSLGAIADPDRHMSEDPISSAIRALRDQRWALLGAFGVFLAIYALYYSLLFTNPAGLNGIITGFSYWLGQHGEARGNQPIYYYALLLGPVYEPLAILASIGFLIALAVRAFRGSVAWPVDLPLDAYDGRLEDRRPASKSRNVRGSAALAEGVDDYDGTLPSAAVMAGLTVSFLAFWSFGALVAYSIAGEKMPWLLMQIAFPFALLAGAGIGRVLGRTDWGAVFREGGLLLGLLIVLLLFAGQALGAAVGTLNAPQGWLKVVILGAFCILMLGGVYWQVTRLGGGLSWRVTALALLALLFAYEVRSSIMASFRNGATPVEMLVYTQTSPDVPEIAQRIERLGRDLTAFSDRNSTDVTGGHSMEIDLDMNETEWPFDWYWRDQKKIIRFKKDSLPQPMNAPIIVASTETKNDAAFQQAIAGKYREERYRLRWWFPEETYKKDGFVGEYFANLVNIGNWTVGSTPGQYLLYRKPENPLGSTDLYLYTRNDLAAQMGNPIGAGTTTTGGTSTAPTSNVTYSLFDQAPQGNSNGQFNQPRGIATAPDGSYYVVDTTNMRIQKFDASGKFVKFFGSEGTDPGFFTALKLDNGPANGTGPGGIAVDKEGAVYVADTWNHRVQKFDADGKFIRAWGQFGDLNPPEGGGAPQIPANANSSFYGPRGLAVGSNNEIYVTDTGNKRVLVFDKDGRPLRQIGDGPGQARSAWNGATQLNEPMGLTLDAQDNVYIADVFNQRIQVFDKTGKALTRWPIPKSGWARTVAFLEPFLASDGTNIYVTDPTNQTVLKFDAKGTLLGSKNASGKTTLSRPTGITLNKAGEVVVVDTEKNAVVNMGQVP